MRGGAGRLSLREAVEPGTQTVSEDVRFGRPIAFRSPGIGNRVRPSWRTSRQSPDPRQPEPQIAKLRRSRGRRCGSRRRRPFRGKS